MEKELRINLTSIFDSKGIDKAKRSFSELERESLRTASSQRSISTASSDAARSVDTLSERVGFMGHAYVGFQAVLAGSSFMSDMTKSAINQADTWNLLEGRLRLVTDSSRQLASVQGSLFDISQESRTGYEQNADLYARIARATQDLNKTQYENLDVTEAISKSFIVSGAASESAKAAVIQLGQGFASGTLRGEELNSVLEQAPRLAEAIADGMGVSVGKLKDMGAEGKLTAEKVYEAIRTQKDAIEKEFDQMPKTVAQSLVVLQNQIGLSISEFDKMHGVTASIGNAITNVSNIIKDHGNEIGNYVGYVGNAVSAILVWKLTSEATAYAIRLQTSATEVSTVATVANSAANTRAAISAIGHSGAVASVTTATTASTIATNALTASTSYLSSVWKSNPLGVAITASYLLYEAVNTLGDGFVTSEAKARDFRNEIKNLSDEILKGKIVEMTAELSSVQKEMNKLSTGTGSDYVNPVYRLQADKATALSYKIREMQELRKESGAVLKDEFKNAESAYNSLVSIGARTPGKLSKQMEKQIADAKFVKDEIQKAIKGDISPSSVKKSTSNLHSDKELKDAAKKAEQLKKLNQDLNDEIFKSTASEYEKSMKLIDDSVTKYRDGGADKIKTAQLVSLKQEEYLDAEYAKAMGQFDSLDKESYEKSLKRIEQASSMYAAINEVSGNWYDNEIVNISNRAAEFAAAGNDIVDINRYVSASILSIDEKRAKEQADLAKKTFEEQNKFWVDLLGNINKAMDDQFFNAMTGKFESFGSWLKDFWGAMTNSLARGLSKSLADAMIDTGAGGIQNIFKTFGGLGSVFGSAATPAALLGASTDSSGFTTTAGGTVFDSAGQITLGGSDATEVLSALSNAKSLYSLATDGITGMLYAPSAFMGNLAGMAYGAGFTGTGSFLAGGANILAGGGVSGLSGAAYAGGLATAGIAGGLGGYAMGSIGDKLLGADTRAGTYGAIGGSIGAIAGSIIPGLGTLVGGAIGSALGSLIGGAFGKTKQTGSGIQAWGDISTQSGAGSVQSYADFKKKSWFKSSSWTNYYGLTEKERKGIEGVFQTYDYLLGQLGDLDTIVVSAGRYSGTSFYNAIDKSFIRAFIDNPELTDTFYTAWTEYASEIGKAVQETFATMVSGYVDYTRNYKTWMLESSGNTLESLRLKAEWAQGDLNAYSNLIGVSGVTVENYLDMYSQAIKTTFTPEAINNWQKLGDALKNSTELTKSYTDALKEQTTYIPTDMMLQKTGATKTAVDIKQLVNQQGAQTEQTAQLVAVLTETVKVLKKQLSIAQLGNNQGLPA